MASDTVNRIGVAFFFAASCLLAQTASIDGIVTLLPVGPYKAEASKSGFGAAEQAGAGTITTADSPKAIQLALKFLF
jgi:hypothetical protein